MQITSNNKNPMVSASILIVTSDKVRAGILHERLKMLGYKVVGIAASRDESVTKIGEFKPDLIMTDINLNGAKEGIKTGSLIQSLYNIPVIYITGNIGQATIQRAKSTGPFGYIFEPYDEKQLLVTIETALVRHQLERELMESRQWFNTTLTSIGDGVIATDEKGLVQFINPMAMELTGLLHTDVIGKPLHEIFLLTDEISHDPMDIASIQETTREKPLTDLEGVLLSKIGKLIQVQAHATPIHDENAEVLGTVLVFRDITKQRKAYAEIQLQANRAEALINAASQLNNQLELNTVLSTICAIINHSIRAAGTAVFLQDSKKAVFRNMAAYSNVPALQTYEGISFEIPSDMIKSMLARENPVKVIPDLKAYPDLPHADLARKHNIKTLVIAGLFRRDQLIGALISIFTQNQEIISVDDINLLRGLADQASNALGNAELFEQVRLGRERQRMLAKSLVDIQEAERRHVAKELHDQLGQSLTGIQFMLENVKNQAMGKVGSQLEEIQESVREAIEQVREISLNLRPSMLDDLGLLPTLQWHFSRYTSQTGIQVNFHFDKVNERLPKEIETAVYRIIQEALTNVAHHAQVKDVFVGLVVHENTLWFEILDKGKGFDASENLDRPSSGLGGMRERASMVGGFLFIETVINQGTQVVASLPLTDKPLERRKDDRYSPFG